MGCLSGLGKIFLFMIAAILLIAYFFGDKVTHHEIREKVNSADASKANSHDAETVFNYPKLPDKQINFLNQIYLTRSQYNKAGNDFQRGAILPSRSEKLCKLPAVHNFEGWYGIVENLTTNGDGFGVLEVAVGADLTISTWNNALSDILSDTLIKPNTNVFDQLGNIEEGVLVKISGRMVRDDDRCISEASLTIRGSIQSPDFKARFSDVVHVDRLERKIKNSFWQRISD